MFRTIRSTASVLPAPSETAPHPRKRKRSQVTRACDACRIHRTKCDEHRPCSGCINRGSSCSSSSASSRQSNAHNADATIETLSRQVRRLRQELGEERNKVSRLNQSIQSDAVLPQVPQHGGTESDFVDIRYQFQEGLRIQTSRSSHKTWYGSSSLFYLIRWITSTLGSKLHQNLSSANMLPDGASKMLHGPTSLSTEDTGRHAPLTDNTIMRGACLTPTQEEYFLNLFWQSYHTSLFPILDESEFKSHYRSLWTGSSETRSPSALVDIVIALCMQYAISMLPTLDQGSLMDYDDATLAGRWYYRRCQMLLAYEMESPSISTFQCHLLCSVYLCSGTFQNMSDSAFSLAVRTAYMLGLHLEPEPTMPLQERESRRRLWWALYVLDSKIGMKLGRPFLFHERYATTLLPGHDQEVATLSGSNFSFLSSDTTWLSFHLYQIKLYQIMRAAYTSFYYPGNQPYSPVIKDVEGLGELLTPYTDRLEAWVDEVPSLLKTERKSEGRPLSCDASALKIEQFAPVWLQRQRLLLELTYHNLCTNLYRPFIFTAATSQPPDIADRIVAHAVALTKITHQVLTSTSILDGWHETFQWQWNAAITLVGFVLAYPQNASTAKALETLDLSVAVFNAFGKSFAVAASAAKIVRDLEVKLDFLLQQSRENPDGTPRPPAIQDTDSQFPEHSTLADGIFDGENSFDLNALLNQDLMEMAFDVDCWGALESFDQI